MSFLSTSSPLLLIAGLTCATHSHGRRLCNHAVQMRTVPALVSNCIWSRLTACFGKAQGPWKHCVWKGFLTLNHLSIALNEFHVKSSSVYSLVVQVTFF